jgi:hypothetical protein
VRTAIRNAGIPTNEIGPEFSRNSFNHLNAIFHCGPGLVHTERHFTFAFVRNPLDYYKSYWSYKMRIGWENPFDNAFMDENFEQFVRNVMEGRPGWVSMLYTKFLGPNGDWVDFVGRQENLRDDLIAALRMAGEDFEESGIFATDPVNISSRLKEWSDRCSLPLSLKKEMYMVEKQAIDLFGYQNPNFELKSFSFRDSAASPLRQSEGASSHEDMAVAASQPLKKPSEETS